jgi:hypothetical protein
MPKTTSSRSRAREASSLAWRSAAVGFGRFGRAWHWKQYKA